ncbi:hypothetical protein BJY01DRAFT_205189 [Aspergillus pseudoustus]|uniref:Uncharacterized protein n=1 Tax=Aspergillus pseudoustus TaxID=1810923 RepID=A0ABR4KQ92_9EURO
MLCYSVALSCAYYPSWFSRNPHHWPRSRFACCSTNAFSWLGLNFNAVVDVQFDYLRCH